MAFRRPVMLAAVALSALLPGAARAQGNLTVYCSVQEEWCRPMMAAFEKSTGIKVLMTRKSAGEFFRGRFLRLFPAFSTPR